MSKMCALQYSVCCRLQLAWFGIHTISFAVHVVFIVAQRAMGDALFKWVQLLGLHCGGVRNMVNQNLFI